MSKLLENALSTLRIILVANNKKIIGAILTFIISIIWILSVSFIVVDFDNYFKIIVFALGSGVGSYLGNIIEEKMALGCINIIFTSNKFDYYYFKNILKFYDTKISRINNGYKFEVNIKRKLQNKIIKIIKERNKCIKVSIIKIFNC